MLDDAEVENLQNEITALEEQLAALKTELREKRFAGVRAAMIARKEADQMLNEELKALGVRRINWHPLSNGW
jgi:cell division septum initiation protein DivIVA